MGDLLIIAAFGLVPEERVLSYLPKLVFVGGANRVKEKRAHILMQQASGEPALA